MTFGKQGPVRVGANGSHDEHLSRSLSGNRADNKSMGEKEVAL